MSNDDNKIFRIEKLDFGVNLKGKGSRDPIKKAEIGKRDYLKDFLKSVKTFTRKALTFNKFAINELSKAKKNFSRSIFLGRGFYFKYIANFALLLIILSGAFVYLSFDRNDPKGFLSKYAGITSANSGVFVNTGSQAFIAEKQFKINQHTVKAGDTISSIAAQYSSPENVISQETIMWANGLNANSVLKPGMVLDIPPVSGVIHTVKKGETVISIAKKYKLIDDKSPEAQVTGAIQQIVDINLLSVVVAQDANGDEIKVPEIVEGSKIIIPGGIIEATKPTQTIRTSSPRAPSSPVFTAPVLINGATFAWPVAGGAGYISQGTKSYHMAVDIARTSRTSASPALVAMANGTITFMGSRNGSCANEVYIRYDNGYESMYCHLAAFDSGLLNSMRTAKSARVVTGQVVGIMGQTGRATGIHVHTEIRLNGKSINACAIAPFKGVGDCKGRG